MIKGIFIAAFAMIFSFGLAAAEISAKDIKEPKLEFGFMIDIEVDKPLTVGKDDEHGLRRLIYQRR